MVELSGIINEHAVFDQLIASPAQEMRISCKAITRINSVGVRMWINSFQKVLAKGVKITLVECSTVIVEQLNMIVNFSAGMKVESILVPLSCGKCRAGSVALFKSEDLKATGFNIPDGKCPACGGTATFDDIAEEYFHFLSR